jgi:hypothetical protein
MSRLTAVSSEKELCKCIYIVYFSELINDLHSLIFRTDFSAPGISTMICFKASTVFVIFYTVAY